MARKASIVSGYARMWPRDIFHQSPSHKLPQSIKDKLVSPSVYVLYREDKPYYVGKTKGRLYRWLRAHAQNPQAKHYNFWNYFSAFAIPDPVHIDAVEAMLIAAMPEVVNDANPKIKRIKLPTETAKTINKSKVLKSK